MQFRPLCLTVFSKGGSITKIQWKRFSDLNPESQQQSRLSPGLLCSRLPRSLLPLFLLVLLLCSCRKAPEPDTRLLVSLLEDPQFTVADNGLLVSPGEDAVFCLTPKAGLALTSTDYAGNYQAENNGTQLRLTLEDVQYPSRISLQFTDHYSIITYDPNFPAGSSGADTAPVSLVHDTAHHLRPNTAVRIDGFVQDGWTLESWNTRPDGTGERIGLGSRATAPESGLTLYAQWAKWSSESDFNWVLQEADATPAAEEMDGHEAPARETVAVVTGYQGTDAVVVIPPVLGGVPVAGIAAEAFSDCTAMAEVLLPECLVWVEDGAFQRCSLQVLTLFDSIETIHDAAFQACPQLQTLQINASEPPYGYRFRRESCYADKADLLILAQNQQKIVFFGGCSVWYNLDSSLLTPLLDQGWQVVNMGINGHVSAPAQLQIIGHYMGDGDILFHTPEFSSPQQMMVDITMADDDDNKLWCGLEYNYDLFALVDLRTVPGALDSFSGYLAKKLDATTYTETFMEEGNVFWDAYGCIPFARTETVRSHLPDDVYLDPMYMTERARERFQKYCTWLQDKGVRIYLSYACINMGSVPAEQQGSVGFVESSFRKFAAALDGPVLISDMEDYLFQMDDFYDTNYHLLSEPARENTARWLRDLQAQMERDGIWEART